REHVWQLAALPHQPSRNARKALAVEILHHEKHSGAIRVELLDVHHVRMADACDRARLFEEHLAEARLLEQMGKDPLHDDRALEATWPSKPREENLRHSARRELRKDLVAPELGQ